MYILGIIFRLLYLYYIWVFVFSQTIDIRLFLLMQCCPFIEAVNYRKESYDMVEIRLDSKKLFEEGVRTMFISYRSQYYKNKFMPYFFVSHNLFRIFETNSIMQNRSPPLLPLLAAEFENIHDRFGGLDLYFLADGRISEKIRRFPMKK